MATVANRAERAEAFSREYAVSTFDGQGDNLMSITELLDQGARSVAMQVNLTKSTLGGCSF